MKVWRYQARADVLIDAPVERVYAVTADPLVVPSYAAEVERIELVERLSERRALVRSHLRIGRLKLAYLYRYHYGRPTHYSGAQVEGRLLRGFFSFTFREKGKATVVSHTEGVLSPIPGVAWVVGFIYFRVLNRGSVQGELDRLRQLVEGGLPQTGEVQLEVGADASLKPTA